MKVAISGSRDFKDYWKFRGYMDAFAKRIQIDMIVSGGAVGTDYMAYQYAIERGITFVCQPPKPEDGYPAKFFRRNLRIVEMSECLIAFPKGKSSGTRHAISLAKKLKKPCYVVEIEDECSHLPADIDYVCMRCHQLVKKQVERQGL